ncbi:hypothetical protein LEN26_002401 [Aphanomyces euteiches]|nr:hypothetical protein LEN26_002401 [Aphanomyces euteiches]
MLWFDFCDERPASFILSLSKLPPAMRLFVTLALATSAVVALNQPRQDSPVLLDHQQIRMDTADNELRVLQGGRDVKHAKRSLRGQDVPTASYDSSARRLSSAGLFSCCFKGQSSGRAAANNPAAIGRQNSMTESQRRDITIVNQVPLAHRQNRRQGRAQGQAGAAGQGGRRTQRQESMYMSGPMDSPGGSSRYSRHSSN